MVKPIYSRNVTRYYAGGRGFATLRAAASFKAHNTIKDEILGPKIDGKREKLWKRVEENGSITDDQNIKDTIKELYAEVYPHSDDCDCWREPEDERGHHYQYHSPVCYVGQKNHEIRLTYQYVREYKKEEPK